MLVGTRERGGRFGEAMCLPSPAKAKQRGGEVIALCFLLRQEPLPLLSAGSCSPSDPTLTDFAPCFPIQMMQEPIRMMDEPLHMMAELFQMMDEPLQMPEKPLQMTEEPFQMMEKALQMMNKPLQMMENPSKMMGKRSLGGAASQPQP